MRTYLEAKAMAKSLRAALAAKNVTLSHSECLEIVARQLGFAEWNMLSAKIDLATGVGARGLESAGISFQPSVPVVPIASAPEAKDFYLGFLDFEADWGWPANNDDPLYYAQISRSGVQLHLRGERPEACGIELFIRMSGLDLLRDELSTRKDFYERSLDVRYTPDDRRELHVKDPFGNWLRFSENNPPGVSEPPRS